MFELVVKLLFQNFRQTVLLLCAQACADPNGICIQMVVRIIDILIKQQDEHLHHVSQTFRNH